MFRIGVYVAQNYDEDYLTPLLDPGVETKHTGSSHGRTEIIYVFDTLIAWSSPKSISLSCFNCSD